ncbi:MAG: RpiB/LacA/LacB family sugar-phosphate isomerase [bacterium]|nr:RpiB/LacA/LacB family sugar-phosphate isomerase [bacterium]
MRIYVGADHRGYGHKEKLVPFLQSLGHEVEDKGAYEYDEDDDYPDFIIPVAREVSQRPNEVKGIILGSSGQGEAMAANKFSDVRAAVYYGQGKCVVEEENVSVIQLSRADNDANILSLGARFITEEEMFNAVKEWLNTDFKNTDRYKRRIAKMDKIHE